ncbi:MAG: U32 family peptidase [Candidatus Magnetoovum sp. WYHC-5]|nr:U32 family peptidase [Candidatus Magnetoovum sp. WYHC-5]
MNKPELLAPAGSLEKLKIALHYGADAVYVGLSEFSLRAKADNFTLNELELAFSYVKAAGKKVYVTINIFPHNYDLSLISEHIAFLNYLKPDAVIVSDLGVFDMLVNVIGSQLPVHISTQANITNYRTAMFWQRQGAKRLILSRELTIGEIKQIRDNVSIELECFVHGAICISYSGRCYISSFLTNRSANKGQCTNSCRWNYTLMEEKRPNEYFPVYENDRGTYVMSSKDLCMLGYLDKLFDAGVDSFKIEGRMKGINYIAGVVKTYREAIDSLSSNTTYNVKDEWLKELAMFSSRGFTTGMFLGRQEDKDFNHDEVNMYKKTHALIGIVCDVKHGKAQVLLRNNLKSGDRVEYLSNGYNSGFVNITSIEDLENNIVDCARNEKIVWISAHEGVKVNDIVRKKLL